MIYITFSRPYVNHCDIHEGMAEELKTQQILIRVRPSLKRIAERAAKDDNRSLSALIETLLTDYLRKNDYLRK